MPVLTLSDALLSWGDLPVLDKADFSLQAGERIGLIGRNGTGKTSLLRVLAKQVPLDEGDLSIISGMQCILVEQEPVLPPASTVSVCAPARSLRAMSKQFSPSKLF